MAKLHVAQDAHGFWFLSLEKNDGSLELLAHQIPTKRLMLDKVAELTEVGPFAGMAAYVDDDSTKENDATLAKISPATAEYSRPEPVRASRLWR